MALQILSEYEFTRHTFKIVEGKPFISVRNPKHSWSNNSEPMMIWERVKVISDWDDFLKRCGQRCMYPRTEGPHKTACLQPGVKRRKDGWLCAEHCDELHPRELWVGYREEASKRISPVMRRLKK